MNLKLFWISTATLWDFTVDIPLQRTLPCHIDFTFNVDAIKAISDHQKDFYSLVILKVRPPSSLDYEARQNRQKTWNVIQEMKITHCKWTRSFGLLAMISLSLVDIFFFQPNKAAAMTLDWQVQTIKNVRFLSTLHFLINVTTLTSVPIRRFHKNIAYLPKFSL